MLKKDFSFRSSTDGFILPVALLILLLVTLIGITGYKTAILQLAMSGNSQFQTVTRSNADSSLVIAENALETQVAIAGTFDFSIAGDGYYNNDEILNVRALNWDTFTAVEAGRTANEAFVIQFDGRQTLPGEDESSESSGLSKTGSYVYAYRVTARSLGLKRSERVVQSVYVTLEQP
ncbi:pilus assembly PilX family protein [Colwellia piezophila]|uniref:pilus assembly PilX family protein n=1 Tax=Colwellia piezophila TaxID=211668 RepID=UPI00037A4F06|nr:PilX N-terminal domain-containing pilus assembly protein [Colwellia piezophila]